MKVEEWRISLTAPDYKVSSTGRIKNKNGQILSQWEHKRKNKNTTYLRVTLIINGMKRNPRVHRLVAEAFIKNPDNKPEVNHLNLDTHDNQSANLEWVSGKENRDHYALCHKKV